MAAPLRYWDTGPFLAWLKPEAHRLPDVEPVILAAEAGKVRLVTSAVTLIEVVKLDQKQAVVQLPPEDADKIREYFRRSYISIRSFDRPTATIARNLIWDHNLSTRDAMHLATAMRWRLDLVETFDVGDLVRLDGLVDDPLIEIRLPRWDEPPEAEDPSAFGEQTSLQLDAGATTE